MAIDIHRLKAMKSSLLVLVVGVGLAGYTVYDRAASRKLPYDEEQITEHLSVAKARLAELEALPPAPPLWTSWQKIQEIGRSYGVEVAPFAPEKGQTVVQYNGPMQAWNGLLRGETEDVFAVALLARQIVPIEFYKVVSSGGTAVLNFSVVGVES